MAQKWYQRATVQAALILGSFGLVSAVVAGFFSLLPERTLVEQDERAPSTRRDNPSNIPELKRLSGAYIARDLGVVVLLGDTHGSTSDVSLSPEDIAFCLQWAKSADRPRLGLSFDPSPDSSDFIVRFFGPIKDTHLGYLLYAADVALKEYALGYRLGGEKLELELTLYDSMLERLYTGVGPETTTRFWLVAHPRLEISPDKSLLLIGSPGATLRAAALAAGQPVELPSAAVDYARWFTANFDVLATREEALDSFARIVEVMAVARWLADRLPEQPLDWFDRYLSREHATPTVLPSIRISQGASTRRSDVAREYATVHVSGGVSLDAVDLAQAFEPSQRAARVEQALLEVLSEDPDQTYFVIQDEGKAIYAWTVNLQ